MSNKTIENKKIESAKVIADSDLQYVPNSLRKFVNDDRPATSNETFHIARANWNCTKVLGKDECPKQNWQGVQISIKDAILAIISFNKRSAYTVKAVEPKQPKVKGAMVGKSSETVAAKLQAITDFAKANNMTVADAMTLTGIKF